MSLKSLFDEDFIESKSVLIIDCSNLAHRNLFIAKFELFKNKQEYELGNSSKLMLEDDMFVYWKYLMLNSLLSSIRQFKPNKVIIALDDRKNWRKEIYTEYKFNRKEKKDQDIDWEKFYIYFNKLQDDLIKIFTNIVTLKVENCEADDVIAILSKELHNTHKITIISTDKDFLQLQQYKNVNQYNPIDKRDLKCIDPIRELQIKLLTGDSGDNIPCVKIKRIIKNIKKPPKTEYLGIGDKTAIKILDAGLDVYNDNQEFQDSYKMNTQLIDFKFIPLHISEKIINKYKDYQISALNGKLVLDYFLTENFNNLYNSWQQYSNFVKQVL